MGAFLTSVCDRCKRVQAEAKITSQTYVEFVDALTKDDYVTVLKLVVEHWKDYDAYAPEEKARADRAVDAVATKLASM